MNGPESHDGRIYYFEDAQLPKWTINIDYLTKIFDDRISDEQWMWWNRFTVAYKTVRESSAVEASENAQVMMSLIASIEEGELNTRASFLGGESVSEFLPDWISALKAIIRETEGKQTVYWIAGGEHERLKMLETRQNSSELQGPERI